MNRQQIKQVFDGIIQKRGGTPSEDEGLELRAVGFRSLDFSEMALRVEREVGRELNFDAALMRSIRTIDDVLSFFEKSISQKS
jgi:acyl carrier protein